MDEDASFGAQAAAVLDTDVGETGRLAAGSDDAPGVDEVLAGLAVTAHDLVEVFVLDRNPILRDRLADKLELLDGPYDRVSNGLRSGDLLVRGAIGEGQAIIALLADGELRGHLAAERQGWQLEGILPGRYALVTEGGSQPRTLADRWARRITDQQSNVPVGQALLRRTGPTPSATTAPTAGLKSASTGGLTESITATVPSSRSQLDDGLTVDTAGGHEEGYWSAAEEYETGAELDDDLIFELEFDEGLEQLSEEPRVLGEAGGEADAAGESCKKKWLAEVDALPAEVRNAIAYVVTSGTLDLYLLAIRNGIRDDHTLLRLMYYSWYGSQYGYCEPKSRTAKAGWNEMAAALKAYKNWPQPPAAQAAPVLCSKQKPVKIPPDAPALDITGRYYTLYPPSTYVINQAGQHIEGVGSLVLESSSNKSGDHRPVTLFQGDLRGRTYYWFNRDKPSNYGRISERGGNFFISLGLRGNSIDWEWLRPIEKRPTLIPTGDLDRSFDEEERYELTPLTPVQMQFILAILDKGKLDRIFDLYFNAQKRHTAMGALGRRLVDTPDHESYIPRLEKFHDVDLPLVRLYARQVLTFHKWKSSRNVIRSHIDWIQMMIDNSLPPGALATSDYKRYLGMNLDPQRAGQEGEHTYEFTIQLTGASLLLGGYIGTVTVEKTSGRKWEKTFDIEFWGGNVSLTLFDAKIGSEFKGAGHSYLEWTENDIPGRVRLARASASVGMELAGAQAGFMHVLGDDSLPPLDVFFWEAKLGVPNVNKVDEEAVKAQIEKMLKGEGGLTPEHVIGLDVGVSVLWGTISESGSILDRLKLKSVQPKDLDLSRDLQTDVSVVRSLDTQVHFCLDDDQPTAAAIQALRIVCARELPLFMTPDSYLVIVGHADTLGSEEHNKDLSQRRADNTLQAIRNILGKKFKIEDDGTHIRKVARGEELAAKESPTKETPAPKHRRVQIFLNSVLVLTLFGQSSIAAAPVASQTAP
jgi:outer membrane protein OmpA-like peptidoglycan-associated protein